MTYLLDINNVKKGDNVKCKRFFENHWGGCDQVQDYLEVDEIYTLSCDPEIHSSYTKIYLEEFPDKVFNSVHFGKIEAMTCGKNKVEVELVESYENIKIVRDKEIERIFYATVNNEMAYMGDYSQCKKLFTFGKKIIMGMK